jgi:hypothetical protein
MDTHDLISAIESHSAKTGLKASTICQYAITNRLFYHNLVAGKDYRVGTAKRLLDWIASRDAAGLGDNRLDDIADPSPVVADPASNAPQNGGRR